MTNFDPVHLNAEGALRYSRLVGDGPSPSDRGAGWVDDDRSLTVAALICFGDPPTKL